MAQHSNYAKDRDLMMEAYASVEGEVPKTSSSAMPRMLNESSCNSEHEEHKHLPAEDGSCATHSDEEHSEDAEHSPITDCTDAIDKLAEMLKGNDKVAVFEDLRDYLAAKLGHEDGEYAEDGEHAGYSVGDIINGYDGEEIVTAVEADGTIFTRELGDGGNKYTPEEINNLPEDGEHAHKAEDGE